MGEESIIDYSNPSDFDTHNLISDERSTRASQFDPSLNFKRTQDNTNKGIDMHDNNDF